MLHNFLLLLTLTLLLCFLIPKIRNYVYIHNYRSELIRQSEKYDLSYLGFQTSKWTVGYAGEPLKETSLEVVKLISRPRSCNFFFSQIVFFSDYNSDNNCLLLSPSSFSIKKKNIWAFLLPLCLVCFDDFNEWFTLFDLIKLWLSSDIFTLFIRFHLPNWSTK